MNAIRFIRNDHHAYDRKMYLSKRYESRYTYILYIVLFAYPIKISKIVLGTVTKVREKERRKRNCGREIEAGKIEVSNRDVDLLVDSGSESGSHKAGVGGTRGSGGHKSGGGSDGKPTRVRTVLNEKQLHTLRTCYAANPRPDALMKEQLVEMTGLSPRVIRVWFQNKRCKDKKKTIAMKQQMQEKVGIRVFAFRYYRFR